VKYSDIQRIEKIKGYTEKLLVFLNAQNITSEQVLCDETVRWTITTPLYNIGEHTYNLSDEFKRKFPDIPWGKISGLRHRLVHDYENTNWSIINDILFGILPVFFQQINSIYNEHLKECKTDD
jgi:uncharacterized protein with HEPN domain